MQTIDSIRTATQLNPILQQQGITQEDLLPASQTSSKPEASFAQEAGVAQKIHNLERSKHLLNGRVDELQRHLESTQEALRSALSRLDGAEAKLRALRFQGSQETSAAQPKQQPIQETTTVQEPEPMPAQAEQPKGATTDPSVSIENIFYCGAK